jgi:hypothetical protein
MLNDKPRKSSNDGAQTVRFIFGDLKNLRKMIDAVVLVNQCESKLSLPLDLQNKNARFMNIKGIPRDVKETDNAGFAHRG